MQLCLQDNIDNCTGMIMQTSENPDTIGIGSPNPTSFGDRITMYHMTGTSPVTVVEGAAAVFTREDRPI
jgi:hypothetical protein